MSDANWHDDRATPPERDDQPESRPGWQADPPAAQTGDVLPGAPTEPDRPRDEGSGPDPDAVRDAGDAEHGAPVGPSGLRRIAAGLRITGADVAFYALLAIILAGGWWLRFTSQNWDDYTHLHPDERFLTEVVTLLDGSLRFTDETPAEQEAHLRRCIQRNPGDPENPLTAGQGGYFDAECSALNPNNLGKGLYVYGQFPLFTVHAAGVARSRLSQDWHAFIETFDPDAADTHVIRTHWEGYSGAQLIGRNVAAVADWLTILVLLLLGRRLYGRWPGLLAAGFYAVAAFPLQQSSFWTVDSFTTFWTTLAIYCAVRALDGASARQGPLPLVYLALWAGATLWEAGYHSYSILGLVSLGIIFLVLVVVTTLVSVVLRAGGWPGGKTLVAASGLLASLVYLVLWTVLDLAAPRDFPITDDLLGLGFASLIYGLAAATAFVVAGVLRRQALGFGRYEPADANPQRVLALGAVGVLFVALIIGTLIGGLAPWPALLVALATLALLVFDATELTDYALFGLALGAAVASRINMAPLAGIIVVAAAIRALPALDRRLERTQRNRLLAYAMTGVVTAAVVSFVVFRVLQPHAFMGPGLFGLQLNPGWRDDASQAAYLTSGDWDAPPNHQWASRTPYWFPWRNIVLWGFGPPLGVLAWAAWAWAGVAMLRARPLWTRHTLPFLWTLVVFGWLGGRWVPTMRYFLPLYPMLALFGAWALLALIAGAARLRADRFRVGGVWRVTATRGAALALLAVVVGYTVLYGFAFHNIHRHQLTRVAASRWFQETVPGDFGLWIERDDGQRQLVNIGRGYVAQPPSVVQLQTGETQDLALVLNGQDTLVQIALRRVTDPLRDPGPERLRVRLFREDGDLGRQLVYEMTVEDDFSAGGQFGAPVTVVPDEPVPLVDVQDPNVPLANYTLQITVEDGPVTLLSNLQDGGGQVFNFIGVTTQAVDQTVSVMDLNLEAQPLLTGHGSDIPGTPTHWTVQGSDPLQFTIPVDGTIRELHIPHLGDPLRDADAETVRFTLIGPDGTRTSATVSTDLNAGADPLGPAQTLVFDPPLTVRSHDPLGNPQVATLVVEAEDPVYTSGPVIAWEGDWDDPVPWPVCPIPDDMDFREDLPSGLSAYNCIALGMYSDYYTGLKLWMVAEDNEQKYQAMTNALDQADYIVITSNRFYDSLPRIPMRWPMTVAYYDALFDGRLGFELVEEFTSPPRIGPITFKDQILPPDDLPDWLNEHWEAEEAFHVYDHPAVLVYRKTDAYSPENTRAILNSVSRRPSTTALLGYVADPEPIGQVIWGAKQASEAPTLIELDDDKFAIQTENGTWTDLYNPDSIINTNQAVAVIVWWLLMVVVGWLAFPLLFVMFPALPDRGFAFGKIAGWLLVAWTAWAAGTLNVRLWNASGIALLLALVALLSAVLIWRRRAAFVAYLRANARHIGALEGLTLALFLAFLAVRQTNPDLWHNNFGGEKPMDFAYFNAVLRSTVFPPLDPWYAGGYINYYYFGYVLVGAPVKLIGLEPSVAYNIIIPTLFALTGVGVFSIAYNWVRARYTRPGDVATATSGTLDSGTDDASAEADDAENPDAAPPPDPAPAIRAERRAPAGNPWVAGMLALLLAVVLGNLGTWRVFVTNVAKLDGWEQPLLLEQERRQELEARRTTIYDDFFQDELDAFRDDHGGSEPEAPDEVMAVTQRAQERTNEYIDGKAEHPPLVAIWAYDLRTTRKLTGAFFGGLDDFLSGEPLPMHTHRWYWGPTRIITELPQSAGRGAIAEMPYFTFLYGDLHAHMIAFPLTLLVLAWLLAEILGAGHGLRTGREALLALILGGITVGVLRPTNSWDWITYLLLGGAGLVFAAWLDATRAHADRPPSRAFQAVWEWLRPYRVRDYWLVLFAVPLALIARLGYYVIQNEQREQQLQRGLGPGEEWIDPAITFSSVVIWALAGVALVVVLYLALLIALRAHINRRVVVALLARLGVFLGVSMVAALPFTMYFATAYDTVKPWEQETTPLWAYLYVHGTFLFIIASFLVWQTARWLRTVRVRALQGLLIPALAGLGFLGIALLGGLVYGVREVEVAQIAVPLMAWATLLFLLPNQSSLLRAVYALMVLGLAISLGVELVVLDGDIGRQNTVFKFYLQVWFMFSITGGVALAWMLRSLFRWNVVLLGTWQTALALLLVVAAAYPVLATQGRALDRFAPDDTPLTLDGMAYMQHAVHGEAGLYFRLENDYNMIRWLQQNVEGTPVIMEGRHIPSEYHWGGRISIYTGLPTILGWRFHQIQQHSLPDMDRLVQTRENNVAAFYELEGIAGIEAAMNLRDHYEIEYIIVGALERAVYGDIQLDPDTGLQTAGHSTGLQKFDTMVGMGLLDVVYEAPNCIETNIESIEQCAPEQVYLDRIYRFVPGASLPSDAAAATDVLPDVTTTGGP